MWLCWFGLAWAGAYEDGVTALRQGRSADAASLLLQAVSAEPDQVDALWHLGWAHWGLDDFSGAAACWSKVQVLQPGYPQVTTWAAAAKERGRLASLADTKPAALEEKPDSTGLVVVAAGDTMMGSDLQSGASGLADGWGEELFAPTKSLFKAADVAFVNLEGPLADGLPSSKCGPGSTSCYAFRTPTRYALALADASIDMVSLANNHAWDLGPVGQQSTMDALDKVKVAHAGRYSDVGRIERNGQTIALVAAHSGSCCLNVNRLDEISAAVRDADTWADIVVFSFHGGAEGKRARHVPGQTEIAWGERRGDVRALAHAAVDAGADVVVGHGPHVLRGMEVYRGRFVAYSLGNFMGYKQFGHTGGYIGHSVVAELTLAKNGALVSGKLHPVKLSSVSIPELDTSKTGLRHVRELSKSDLGPTGVDVDEQGNLSWGQP